MSSDIIRERSPAMPCQICLGCLVLGGGQLCAQLPFSADVLSRKCDWAWILKEGQVVSGVGEAHRPDQFYSLLWGH